MGQQQSLDIFRKDFAGSLRHSGLAMQMNKRASDKFIKAVVLLHDEFQIFFRSGGDKYCPDFRAGLLRITHTMTEVMLPLRPLPAAYWFYNFVRT